MFFICYDYGEIPLKEERNIKTICNSDKTIPCENEVSLLKVKFRVE